MNDPDLDRLLRTWAAPEVPADDFRRAVWQRLAHHEATAPRWQRWLETVRRPRMALAAFAVALLMGSAGGLTHAALRSQAAPATVADASAAYVQSINPLDPLHLQHTEPMP